MSGEYVPTADEIRYRVEHDWEPYGDGSFDAWLAAHDAQVRAEALREAASTILRVAQHGGDGDTSPAETARWLLDRADDIARGGRG